MAQMHWNAANATDIYLSYRAILHTKRKNGANREREKRKWDMTELPQAGSKQSTLAKIVRFRFQTFLIFHRSFIIFRWISISLSCFTRFICPAAGRWLNRSIDMQWTIAATSWLSSSVYQPSRAIYHLYLSVFTFTRFQVIVCLCRFNSESVLLGFLYGNWQRQLRSRD